MDQLSGGRSLGYSDYQIFDPSAKGNPLSGLIEVGVVLKGMGGRIKDLWMIQKAGGGEIVRSPIVREQLFRARYYIYVRARDTTFLEEVSAALQSPVYALSLGRDDELVVIKNNPEDWPITLLPLSPPITLRSVLLPFNISKLKHRVTLKPGVVMRPHVVENLPNRFVLNNGIREPNNRSEFTFLTGYEILLDEPIEAYSDGEYNVVFL